MLAVSRQVGIVMKFITCGQNGLINYIMFTSGPLVDSLLERGVSLGSPGERLSGEALPSEIFCGFDC